MIHGDIYWFNPNPPPSHRFEVTYERICVFPGVDAAPHIQKTSKVGAGSSPFHGVALVFGLHAYHTGKFLGHCESLGYTLPQHVPVVLVFGGTDVYGAEYLTSPSHMVCFLLTL